MRVAYEMKTKYWSHIPTDDWDEAMQEMWVRLLCRFERDPSLKQTILVATPSYRKKIVVHAWKDYLRRQTTTGRRERVFSRNP